MTGGLLTDLFPVGSTIGMTVTSEDSSFSGDFAVDFDGEAKGNLGVPVAGMVGDTVFADVDGDGLQCRDGIGGPLDGVCQATEPRDPGIPGVKVNLTSLCDDPADDVDPTDPASMQRTDATGFYKFTGLPLNCKYTVTVDPCNFDATPGATCGDGGPAGALVGLAPTTPQVGPDICQDSGGLDDFNQPVDDMAMTFLPIATPVSEQSERTTRASTSASCRAARSRSTRPAASPRRPPRPRAPSTAATQSRSPP